jgi:hypothetical protein
MTKTEANIIIQVCLGQQIFHTCRSEGDTYLINCLDAMDFRDFEAAKLVVNSLVLEYRAYPKPPKESKPTSEPTGLNFKRYSNKNKMNSGSGNWGERRMQE